MGIKPKRHKVRQHRYKFNVNRLAEELKVEDSEPTPRVLGEVPIWKKLDNRIQELEERLRAQDTRITYLESTRTSDNGNDLKGQCLRFLKKHEGLKFNSGTIAANIGSTALKLSDRLSSLHTEGLIKREKSEGLSTMWWYEENNV